MVPAVLWVLLGVLDHRALWLESQQVLGYPVRQRVRIQKEVWEAQSPVIEVSAPLPDDPQCGRVIGKAVLVVGYRRRDA